MSKLKCRPLIEDEFTAYDDLVQRQGTVFAQRKWLAMHDANMTLLGLFDGGNRLIGTFPIHTTRKFGLPVLMRSPFTPYNGPYFSKDIESSKRFFETRRFFLSEIASHIGQQRLSLCCLSMDPACTDCMPFRWRGYKVIPGFTYRIKLTKPKKEIQANFSSARRRNIRSALRDSLRIESLESYSLVESLAQKTFDRQNKRFPVDALRRILYDVTCPENSFAFAAFDGSKPIACVFCVFDKHTAYYLIGGYDSADAHPGAGAACMEAAIFKSKSLGLKTFDFEGSVIPPIERYFRGFGGELTSFWTANRAWFPVEVILKMKKRELF